MEKVKVTLNGYDSSKTYQLFLRVNDENGVTIGYTCESSDKYTYDRKSPGPRPVKRIEINGKTFNDYIAKGILSYDDFPEMKSSDVMWIAECGMVVIHIDNNIVNTETEKDFIIYDLLHVSDRTFESIQQPSEQKAYDEIDASFRHYVIDVLDGKPQPLMISDTMFYLNADKVDVEYADKTKEQLTRPNNEDLKLDDNVQIPDGYNEAAFTFNDKKVGKDENGNDRGDPVISAIYLYGGNNVTHVEPIDGDVKVEGVTTETGYMQYTFSGTGAISLW